MVKGKANLSYLWKPAVLICCLVLSAPRVQAEVHVIEVGDNYFHPLALSIRVGDTVRWTATINQHLHNVVADDLSWDSGAPAWRWEYEKTFNTPGEILYHCSEHSEPGKDPLTGAMNGSIQVEEDDAEGPLFQINAALSDAWFNSATDGQGFFIIVWEESGYIFLSWFTFDIERPPQGVEAVLGEPGHRWLTAQGTYQDDTADLEIFMTSGGKFDSSDPPVGAAVKVGTMRITWADCKVGLLTYDIPSHGLTGDIPIERIVLDNVAACEAAQPAQP